MMADILNTVILIVGVAGSTLLMLTGAGIGIVVTFEPTWDFQARWIALLPIAAGTALAVVGLAMTKWMIALT